MAEWKELKQDLSIYGKFDFDYPAVAVKYLFYRPEGVPQLDEQCALCEMFKVAGTKDHPFYITKENENCVGKMPLGWMGETPAYAHTGQIGEMYEIFQEPRANAKLYEHFVMLEPGVVNYVMFARLDVCDFEPDIILMAAKPGQAEIILRAMSYSTGVTWTPKATPVLGCSWLYTYPYKSGNVNYVFTGMHFGMKARKVMPEGYVLISIPYNWIPTITANLNEMKWSLPAYEYATREEWVEAESRMYAELEAKAAAEEAE